MIEVATGQVTLSDRRTRRTWSSQVEDFRIAAVPVTRALYARVVPIDGSEPDRPIDTVSWWDAVLFCNALSVVEGLHPPYLLDEPAETAVWDHTADGYRLPTEAEWEYVCRAGVAGPRYGSLEDIAWYRATSGGRPHDVGTKNPNPWGVYDMLGNVWEWCWEQYDPQVYASYRVLRGGGWADEHWSCRASVRRRSHPTLRIDDVGFRLARSGPGSIEGFPEG